MVSDAFLAMVSWLSAITLKHDSPPLEATETPELPERAAAVALEATEAAVIVEYAQPEEVVVLRRAVLMAVAEVKEATGNPIPLANEAVRVARMNQKLDSTTATEGAVAMVDRWIL